MPHILHVVKSLNQGGAESMLYNVIARTNAQFPDYQSHILSLSNEGILGKRLRQQGNEVSYLNMTDLNHVNTSVELERDLYVRRLSNYLKRHPDIDIVMSWLPRTNIVSALAVQACNSERTSKRLPLIWNNQGTNDELYLNAEEMQLLKSLSAAKVPTLISCCSDTGEAAYREAGIGTAGKKLRIVHNAVDTYRFAPYERYRNEFRQKHNIDAHAPVIIFSARNSKMKDLPTFLAAAKKVHAEHPEAKFLLCGSGMWPDAKNIPQEVQALGDSVILLGIQQQMWKVYAAADIVCNTSVRGEGVSLSLLEGMACGNVPVATDISDAKAIVGNAGVICEPGNADSVAQGLIRAIEHKQEFDPRAQVEQHYSIGKAAADYVQLFEEAAAIAAGRKK